MPDDALTTDDVARAFRQSDKERARTRDRSLVFALWLDRDRSRTADEVVSEAKVIETYLRGDT